MKFPSAAQAATAATPKSVRALGRDARVRAAVAAGGADPAELGWTPRAVTTTIADTAESLRR